ncbi:MAG: Rid family detoxifying hydrolase [Actinomycetota bacterium]|nr:Rid family detoxifying hydrolase [Actinomycetota bacterium]
MSRITIISEGAPKPAGPYSQGIRSGDFVFVSGQIPLDPETNELIEGDMRKQAERALKNLESVLVAGNSSLDMVIKLTVYLVDISDFLIVNSVFSDFFPNQPPARETVQVSGLPKGARIEISAIGLARS